MKKKGASGEKVLREKGETVKRRQKKLSVGPYARKKMSEIRREMRDKKRKKRADLKK